MSDQEEEDTHNESEEEESQDFAESFFESFDRVPSGVSLDNDLRSSDSDSDSDISADDVRISFASAVAPPSFCRRNFDDLDEIIKNQEKEKSRTDCDDGKEENEEEEEEEENSYDYKMWMAEPMSIQERRKKLLQGMGLASNKKLPVHSKSRKLPPNLPLAPIKSRAPSARYIAQEKTLVIQEPENLPAKSLDRCKSENRLALHDSPVFASLFRVSSAPPSKWRKWSTTKTETVVLSRTNQNSEQISPETGDLTIKNLDTGKEFVVTADGAVKKLNDPQTGSQFTMEEFEKFLGFSPIVKEVMRRVTNANNAAIAANGNGNLSAKSRGKSNKKKVSWLKNIKVMASSVTGLISEKEREGMKEKDKSSERLKVHQHGKSYKELSGLYMCQEIQAHQGSIWTMKFSCDSRYLASAGEDRVVNVWQVIECDASSTSLNKKENTPKSPGKQPPLSKNVSHRLGNAPSKKGKKGKGGVPDNILMPETVFSLSAEPVCSFEGHLDDVLDLSWSKSQLLLSSSMDKTVRLWDMESKACLKLFAHNDYVTCIQFNPIDETYFISGSLDAKVRIWSIPDRKVVDWSDMHEMVTAACYTPDGQGALVGSHKGSCRFYNTTDAKLSQEGQIDVTAKKKKSSPKKITGFQFTPDNTSEVLITSADSQIRVFDGIDMIHKFRGFRNVSSQISASCTMDGKYVVCASEDSHVYIWKRDRARINGASKGVKPTTRSHEHFFRKDVSVAIPWPNGSANCEPSPDLPHWSRRSNDVRSPSNLEDTFGSCRSMDAQEDGSHTSPRAIGSSSSSFLGSSFVTSSSSLSSWGWGGGSNRIANDMEEANAWGLVVVTGGLAGNIRIYQNFGLPFRLNRQPNLF